VPRKEISHQPGEYFAPLSRHSTAADKAVIFFQKETPDLLFSAQGRYIPYVYVLKKLLLQYEQEMVPISSVHVSGIRIKIWPPSDLPALLNRQIYMPTRQEAKCINR